MPPEKKKRKTDFQFKSGHPVSPDKSNRVLQAIKLVHEQKVPIKDAAARFNLSYGFLYRRLSGEVSIDRRNGPAPVFNKAEEESMAKWLSEMAMRGMGLTPKEFLEFVQRIVTKEKRKTPFRNNLPSYDWYYSFMARNYQIVSIRSETSLELSRSKLTRHDVDNWYCDFRDFLTAKGLIDKPGQIWNADETGFTMGSKAGKVIGPSNRAAPVPHVTSSKDRLTAMFCGNAEGKMIPPFLIYPGARPMTTCNPLMGALSGTALTYTKSGWMNIETFQKFLLHFNEHAGTARPVVLLIDSVSSHIDMDVFQLAIENGIEMYRIIPNATHLMQPLDKGVFGPLKTMWSNVTREHYRNTPGVKIDRTNFAQKLKDAYMQFYKPLTIVNSFKASGIYPVDSKVISDDHLRPGLTYTTGDDSTVNDATPEPLEEQQPIKDTETEESKNARGALEVFDKCAVYASERKIPSEN